MATKFKAIKRRKATRKNVVARVGKKKVLRPGLKYNKKGKVVRDPNRKRVASRRKAFRSRTGAYRNRR